METGTKDISSLRFQSQMALPDFGQSGQRNLARSSVLVIGAGGLGCPALQYLAASGIGQISICDPDSVTESNLARQVLYRDSDIGSFKVDAAIAALQPLGPQTVFAAIKERFSLRFIDKISSYDLILDCTDSFSSRFEIASVCGQLNKTVITAAAEGWQGVLGIFQPHTGSCYGCATYQDESPSSEASRSCAERGILGGVTGVLGAWQATEAVRWLVHGDSPLKGKLLYLDTLRGRTITCEVPKQSECPFHSVNSAEVLQEMEWVNWEGRLETNELIFDLRDQDEVENDQAVSNFPAGIISWPFELWMSGNFPSQLTQTAQPLLFCERSQRSWIVAHLLRKKGIRCRILRGGATAFSQGRDAGFSQGGKPYKHPESSPLQVALPLLS